MTITTKAVVETAVALAGERPEHVYRSPDEGGGCEYTRGAGGTGCIVGEALMRLGVDREVLWNFDDGAYEKYDEGLGVDGLWTYLEDLGLVDLWTRDHAHGEALQEIQGRQDSGCPWGQAVADYA